jgi:hypothetical protein
MRRPRQVGAGSRAYADAAVQHQGPLAVLFWQFLRKDSFMLRRSAGGFWRGGHPSSRSASRIAHLSSVKPAAAIRRPVDLGFLDSSRFAAKTPVFEAWISLDFLGFSRQNRDLSMGYAGFSAENFSCALPWE